MLRSFIEKKDITILFFNYCFGKNDHIIFATLFNLKTLCQLNHTFKKMVNFHL